MFVLCESLFTSLPFATAPIQILDFFLNFRRQLYWSEYSSLTETGTVKRSDLKGNNIEVVLDNLPLTKGLKIDYESKYWPM